MKTLVPGMDGYIGWSLGLHLASRGDTVLGVDNFSRRKFVEEVGSWSATPIASMDRRMQLARSIFGDRINFYEGDVTNYDFIAAAVKKFQPDSIVHLGEQPSAPFSMVDVQHAVYTQQNNVLGTLNLLFAMRDNCPNAHLIKLGSMGEYGTPGVDIPEGFFDVKYNGRNAKLMFPRYPNSLYHASKVHDSHNIMLACKIWNLRSTDVMQGVVYGTRTNEVNPSENTDLCTRYDFDETFGTIINRHCAEAAIGHALTIYGSGGQTRGFLALIDSIQCLRLIADNPPERGEYRVIDQIDETYSVRDLALIVQQVARKLGIDVPLETVKNPRKEAERHHYRVEAKYLRRFGFRPTRTLQEEIELMLNDLARFRDRIAEKAHLFHPRTTWEKGREIFRPELKNT